MSTIGKLGAVAGGIMGGMNMRNALEKQKLDEERARQDMEWRRQDREYQQSERARAESERTQGNALFDKMAGMKSAFGAQPDAAPVEAPDVNAPDEPTMSVQRASVTPGMASATKPKAFNYDAIQNDMQALNGFKAEAYKLRNPQAIAMVEDKKKELYSSYLAAFDGDPTQDPVGFAQHVSRVSARFGNALTPEQAYQQAKVAKVYEQEGAMEGLKLANSGDKAGALKAYNATGKHQFADLELTPAKSSYGIQSYNVVGVNADGSKVNIGNAMDSMIGLMTAAEQANISLNKQKMDADAEDKRADNARQDKTFSEQVRHNKASESIQSMSARKAVSGSTPAQVQTAEWLVANKVAKDLNQAWEMVGTSKDKSRESAIQDMAGKIMQSGLVKPDVAVAQATQVIDSIRPAQSKGNTGKNANFSKAVEYLNKATNQNEFNANVRALLKQGWSKEQIQEMTQ